MQNQEHNFSSKETAHQKFQSSEFKDFRDKLNHLPQAVETKLALLDFFRQIHRNMNQGVSHEKTLDDVFDALNAIIPFDRIGIALLERNNQYIRLNWVKSKLEVHHLMKNYAVALKDTTLGEVFKKNCPRILNDLEDYYRLHPRSHSTKLALLDGIRSSLTCPLTNNGNAIGVVFFSSGKTHTYENLHADLFCEIADGISLVIEQSLTKKDTNDIKDKESFFKHTLHDLNNPLSVIKGAVDMMNSKPWYQGLDEDAKRTLGILNRNTDAMINLIKNYIYENKEQKREVIHSGARCKFDDFLTEIMSDFRTLAKIKDIKVELQKNSTLPPMVNFDAFKIKEALLNYMSNAVKFSQDNTTVRLEVFYKKDEQKIFFLVVDEGQGIPEDEQYKLFQEYGTTSTKPTSGEPTIGLGLSNVKKLVEYHGGEVFVISKEGVGSSFGFWIPI